MSPTALASKAENILNVKRLSTLVHVSAYSSSDNSPSSFSEESSEDDRNPFTVTSLVVVNYFSILFCFPSHYFGLLSLIGFVREIHKTSKDNAEDKEELLELLVQLCLFLFLCIDDTCTTVFIFPSKIMSS